MCPLHGCKPGCPREHSTPRGKVEFKAGQATGGFWGRKKEEHGLKEQQGKVSMACKDRGTRGRGRGESTTGCPVESC